MQRTCQTFVSPPNTDPCCQSYGWLSSFWSLNIASLCLPQRKLCLSPCTSLCPCVFARLLPSSNRRLRSWSQRISWNKPSGWDPDIPRAGHSLIFCLFSIVQITETIFQIFKIFNYFLILGYKLHEKKDLDSLVHCSKAISSNETWPRVKKVVE